jgi:hypothetical protein
MTETTQALSRTGIITFWTVGRFVHLAPLKAGLEAAGFGAAAPAARTPQAALRDALEEVFPLRTHRVEPLKNRSAFEVVCISRGEERNEYRHERYVGIDEARSVSVRPYDLSIARAVVAAFGKHAGLVRCNDVSNSLLAVLGQLAGVPLKPGGHIYWLPGPALAQWRHVSRAVEQAPTQGGASRVQVIKHALDADEVRAVRDGILAEVSAETARIKDEVMNGELGRRAIHTRPDRGRGLPHGGGR